MFRPAYLTLPRAKLKELVARGIASLEECRACPRDCGVNRLGDKWAACKTGRYAVVSSYFAHFGEEDCLRGWNGSGTIFFSHCNLRCVFCQNWDISQAIKPKHAPPGSNPREIASMMLELQARGCHNINFVTPEHVVPQVLESVAEAIEEGLALPIVYNTSARQLLAILFSNQGPEGGWPQWWMFDRYHWVRAADFHADILHWCLLALSNYVRSSGDTAFLDEPLPFYVAESSGPVETAPLSEHVDRLVALVTGSYFPETSLVPFGGGDWNDAMQPADPELGERMISTWTVELNYQAFAAYAELCERTGRQERAAELSRICDSIRKDFNRHLMRDGIVSGHGLLQDDGSVELLLHPSDTRTGISYRLLPMMRGIISGIFTPEQARRHLELIERHLKGPDGARLMDRPPKYRGGLEKIFRRAESSSYFGREIGLMYMHAHLRYAESLAIMGCPDAFLKALRQAVPIDYQSVVPIGDSRQANCYYSSSDVILDTRYEAERRYEDLKAGRIPLKGGWRIYSSGPGIYIGLVVSRLLGLRQVFGDTLIDPVMPKSLDGLSASIDHDGLPVTLIFEVREDGVGPKSIEVNGQPVEFKREDHPYRLGGALIPAEVFVGMLTEPSNIIRVQL